MTRRGPRSHGIVPRALSAVVVLILAWLVLMRPWEAPQLPREPSVLLSPRIVRPTDTKSPDLPKQLPHLQGDDKTPIARKCLQILDAVDGRPLPGVSVVFDPEVNGEVWEWSQADEWVVTDSDGCVAVPLERAWPKTCMAMSKSVPLQRVTPSVIQTETLAVGRVLHGAHLELTLRAAGVRPAPWVRVFCYPGVESQGEYLAIGKTGLVDCPVPSRPIPLPSSPRVCLIATSDADGQVDVMLPNHEDFALVFFSVLGECLGRATWTPSDGPLEVNLLEGFVVSINAPSGVNSGVEALPLATWIIIPPDRNGTIPQLLGTVRVQPSCALPQFRDQIQFTIAARSFNVLLDDERFELFKTPEIQAMPGVLAAVDLPLIPRSGSSGAKLRVLGVEGATRVQVFGEFGLARRAVESVLAECRFQWLAEDDTAGRVMSVWWKGSACNKLRGIDLKTGRAFVEDWSKLSQRGADSEMRVSMAGGGLQVAGIPSDLLLEEVVILRGGITPVSNCLLSRGYRDVAVIKDGYVRGSGSELTVYGLTPGEYELRCTLRLRGGSQTVQRHCTIEEGRICRLELTMGE